MQRLGRRVALIIGRDLDHIIQAGAEIGQDGLDIRHGTPGLCHHVTGVDDLGGAVQRDLTTDMDHPATTVAVLVGQGRGPVPMPLGPGMGLLARHRGHIDLGHKIGMRKARHRHTRRGRSGIGKPRGTDHGGLFPIFRRAAADIEDVQLDHIRHRDACHAKGYLQPVHHDFGLGGHIARGGDTTIGQHGRQITGQDHTTADHHMGKRRGELRHIGQMQALTRQRLAILGPHGDPFDFDHHVRVTKLGQRDQVDDRPRAPVQNPCDLIHKTLFDGGIAHEIDHQPDQIPQIRTEIPQHIRDIPHRGIALRMDLPRIADGTGSIKIHLPAGKDHLPGPHPMLMAQRNGPVPMALRPAIFPVHPNTQMTRLPESYTTRALGPVRSFGRGSDLGGSGRPGHGQCQAVSALWPKYMNSRSIPATSPTLSDRLAPSTI